MQTVDAEVESPVAGSEAPYGHEFFETLRSLGGLTFFTASLRYAKIQQLKAAGRDETLRIIRGKLITLLSHDDLELESHADQGSGAELAEWLYMREKWLRAKILRLLTGLLILFWVLSFLSSLGK